MGTPIALSSYIGTTNHSESNSKNMRGATINNKKILVGRTKIYFTTKTLLCRWTRWLQANSINDKHPYSSSDHSPPSCYLQANKPEVHKLTCHLN